MTFGSDLYDYLLAVAGYWKWLVTGGPWLLENIVKRFKPEWIQLIDKKISPATRLKFEVGIFLVAVFLAGFLAWRDERASRLAADNSNPHETWNHPVSPKDGPIGPILAVELAWTFDALPKPCAVTLTSPSHSELASTISWLLMHGKINSSICTVVQNAQPPNVDDPPHQQQRSQV